MTARKQQIEDTLTRLEAFRGNPAYSDKQYAIQANIVFLKAARSLLSYLWWLFMVAPKLDGSRLLELTDFPVEEWDVAMHERLIELQKRKQPGLIVPLVNTIIEYIQKEPRNLIVANLGAGGMEVDKQVAEWALKTNHSHTLTIVAVDKSPITRRIADKNLRELASDVEIIETGELTASELEQMRKNATKKILVVMCTNDIFELDKKFPAQYFDLVYHSLFRHHLNPVEQEKLDDTIQIISKKHFEFDGYKSWAVVVPQTIVGWEFPHFLNGELFSNLRFKEKQDIIARAHAKGDVSFYSTTGFYLLEYYS